MNNYHFKCACEQTAFNVLGQPQFRMLCHCTICQKFNAAPRADILVYKMSQVTMPADGAVSFSTFKRPPNVQRGKCVQCGQAAIEVFNMPLMPKLVLVPVGMVDRSAEIPEPKAHMFYDKRLADAQDDIPKHQGFIPSQWAFFKYLWFPKRS